MLVFPATLLSLSMLSFSGLVYGAQHGIARRRHEGVSARSDISKRFENARFTWYIDNTNEVACGGWYKESDYVVALNEGQFEGGKHCFEMVSITANGQTVQAQIVDECPYPCPNNALDLSTGLFTHFFGGLGQGEIDDGVWEFSNGASNPPPPSSSSKWVAPSSSSSKWVAPSSSYTSSSSSIPPPPSSTSSSSKVSSTSPPSSTSFSSSSSSSSTSGASVPTGCLAQLGLAMGGIGEMIVAGAAV